MNTQHLAGISFYEHPCWVGAGAATLTKKQKNTTSTCSSGAHVSSSRTYEATDNRHAAIFTTPTS